MPGCRRYLGDLKRAFTTIRIDPDSGIVVQDPHAPSWYVKRIRLWNLVEPFMTFAAILLIVWTSRMDPTLWWMWAGFSAILLWTLVLSPFVHWPYEKHLFLTDEQRRRGFGFYFFECRGLGSPMRYYRSVLGEPPQIRQYWRTILACTVFVDLLFISAAITFRDDLLLRFPCLTQDGLLRQLAFHGGLLLLLDAGLVLVCFPVMLRLDNLHDSLGYMSAFFIVIALAALAGNVLFQLNEDYLRVAFEESKYMALAGPRASERLTALDVFAVCGQWSGYVFWGFLQQLLFLGVFATQLCRAFDIGRSRGQLMLACLCSAALFGLIHLPNFWLSIVTWVGGFFGTLFAVQCRNLFTLGVVHGFGGTMFDKLLPIPFSAGPR
ncbi:MAG: hypothetical protein GWP08_03930 [Nitrospiraceae bacterium]|nr:hypothetical protein [Nitrospiraceae bacterium]